MLPGAGLLAGVCQAELAKPVRVVTPTGRCLRFMGQGNGAKGLQRKGGRAVRWRERPGGHTQIPGGVGGLGQRSCNSTPRHPSQHHCGHSQFGSAARRLDLSSASDQSSSYPLAPLASSVVPEKEAANRYRGYLRGAVQMPCSLPTAKHQARW